MLSISPDVSVASVLATHPGAARIFARHKIDFCCRGHLAMGVAIRKSDVSFDALVGEIMASHDAPPAIDDSASTAALIDHIVARHHRPLDEELPRLLGLADKVARVHGGPTHAAVLQHMIALRDDLVPHMDREEQVLFPLMLAGDARAAMPIKVMSADHELIGEILRELAQLTQDYAAPAEACGSWRALWEGIGALQADLHTHIHLENNLLFPRFTPPART